MKQFLVRRWFLLALACVLTIGFLFATQLQFLAGGETGRYARMAIVAGVLFLMSFPLGFGSFYESLRLPPALLATTVNYGLLPLVAWGLYFLVAPYIDQGLAIGILVAAATPSTLASAAVWTRRAGGNDTVALMVTVITNASCFIITPIWLFWMTGAEVQSLNMSSMIFKLLILVVLPMAFAQLLRRVGKVGSWASRQKTPMGVMAQWGVLSMIFLGSINAGAKIRESGVAASSLALDGAIMMATILGLHLAMLGVGHLLAYLLKMRRADRIAVGFSGSQKTLMVGLAIAVDDYSQFGLAVLPMVTFHVGQLLVDTVVADYLKRHEKPQDAG